jgi:hypothetical protein
MVEAPVASLAVLLMKHRLPIPGSLPLALSLSIEGRGVKSLKLFQP